MHEVSIYTDGACAGNGRPDPRGGWAAVVRLNGSPTHKTVSGGEKPSTNQRMEIRAAIEGLKALTKPCVVTVYSDSAYVVNCMERRWFAKWRANGWITSKRTPVENSELWNELLGLVEERGHRVTFVKVAGHADRKAGHVSSEHERFNQLADELAVAAIPPS